MSKFIKLQYGPDADANSGGVSEQSTSGGKNSGWLNSLIESLPGIAVGAAAIIGATKSGTVQTPSGSGGYYPQDDASFSFSIWWIVGGLVFFALLFWLLKSGKVNG